MHMIDCYKDVRIKLRLGEKGISDMINDLYKLISS